MRCPSSGVLAVGIVLGLVLGGCGTSPTGSEDASGGGDPQVHDWELALSRYEGLEPGEVVTFGVTGDYPETAVIWVDRGTDDEYWVPLIQPAHGPSSRDRLQISLPVLLPGSHELQVGTPDGPRSNPVEVEVITPERRYSQEEAAAIIEGGLAALGTGTWALLSLEDSLWTPFREAALGDAWGDLEAWFETVPGMAAVAGDYYREIPADEELNYQALLHHSGILPLLREMAEAGVSATPGAAVSGFAAGPEPPVPALAKLPQRTHSVLFLMDLWIAAMDGMDSTLTIAGVVGAGSATGGSGSVLAGLAMSAITRITRGAVQMGVPTELVSIEPHHQSMVYEHQRIRELWWGHLRPSEKLGEGIASLTVDLATAGLKAGWGKAVPDGKNDWVTEAVGEVIARLKTRVPALALLELDYEGEYLVEAKTAINPGAYTLLTPDGLTEFAVIVPAIGGPPTLPLVPLILSTASMMRIVDAVIGLPEKGLKARAADGSGAATAAAEGFQIDYWNEEIYFPPVDFPDGGPKTAQAEVVAHTFNLTGKSIPFGALSFFSVPWIETREPVGHPIQVNDWEGPQDPKPFNGRSIVYNNTIDPGGIVSRRWAIKGDEWSGYDRHFEISLADVHPCTALDNYEQSITLRLNDARTAGGAETVDQDLGTAVALDLWAHPGLSSIDFEVSPGCGLGTDPQGYTLWILVDFPGAMNRIPTTVELKDDEAVTRRVNIWTPPCFEPCGGRP